MSNHYENIAVLYLRKAGKSILARNFRLQRIEVDIMALRKQTATKDELIELVEVKARKDTNLDYEPISRQQILRYHKFAGLLQARAGKYLNIQIKLLLIDKRNNYIEEIKVC